MAEYIIVLKLLINKHEKKVMWAECNNDFLEFLFGALSLPMGSVMAIGAYQTIECGAGNLYKSIQKLELYKERFKRLSEATAFGSNEPVLGPRAFKQYFSCHGCNKCISDDQGAVCPRRKCHIDGEATYVAPPAVQNKQYSFDAANTKYIVLDNLKVVPQSFLECMRSLKEAGDTNIEEMEEKFVEFNMNEATRTLSILYQSNTVLTDVFLKSADAVEVNP